MYNKLNLKLYCKDIKVADFRDSELNKVYNSDLLPTYFRRSHNIEPWLESRAVDSHRPSSRLLKKCLRLKDYSDISTVLEQHAASILDPYWVCDIDNQKQQGQLSYKDIRVDILFNSYVASVALRCDYDSIAEIYNNVPVRNPELTNIGSFEKCWIKDICNDWWLIKKNSQDELFSEMFCYILGKRLGFKMAEYEVHEEIYIKSKNFINGRIFEPMWNLVGDDDDYTLTINNLAQLDSDETLYLVFDFLKIIYLDTLVQNPDRHTKNYGFIRNSYNGSIMELAPNFDNNLALISRGTPNTTQPSKVFCNLFIDVLSEVEVCKKYVEYFKDICLTLEDLEEVYMSTSSITNINHQPQVKQSILCKVYNTYQYIKECLRGVQGANIVNSISNIKW